MAFSITCPHCSAKLKTATAIAAGRSVACPKCKNSFAVSRDNIEEIPDTKGSNANPAGRSAASTSKSAPPARSRASDDDNHFGRLDEAGKKKRRDEEDDDRPPKRGRGDDDDMPRSRKRVDDDDDDRPRSRKRVIDDDDDDRPSKRKRTDDEDDDRPRARKRVDDDDRPSKRKRVDDDDDDDDRPRSRKRVIDDDDRPRRRGGDDDDFDDDRPRKRKKKKKSKRGLMIGLTIGGVIAVAGIVFLCIWMFGGGGYDEEMIAFMPSDTNDLDFENVEKIADISKFKKIAEREFTNDSALRVFKEAGLTVSDISKALKGRTDGGASVTVVRLKKALDKGKVTQGATESKANNKSYHKMHQGVGDSFIHFASDKLIVQASTEEVMKTLLNKDEGKVVISEQLQDLAKKVAKGEKWTAHVTKNAGGGAAFDIPGMSQDDKDVFRIMQSAKGNAMRIDISSSSLDITHYTLCADSESANKIVEIRKKKRDEEKGKVEQMFNNQGPGGKNLTDAQKAALKKMISNADISKSGSYLEISTSLDLGPFTDELDGIPGMF